MKIYDDIDDTETHRHSDNDTFDWVFIVALFAVGLFVVVGAIGGIAVILGWVF